MFEPDTIPLPQEIDDERRLRRWALAAVLGMAVVRLFVASTTLLSADEAYYWNWIHPLQLSYLDHPAMVAYWIWAGVHLAGETALGVRLPAVLMGLAVSALIWDLARLAFHSRRAGWLAVLWLNSALLFCSAGVIITPDTPLLLFWSLALWAVLRLLQDGRARWLYLLGLALGLGAISKYTMALILPGLAATFLIFTETRRWLWSRHLWLAGLLGALCLTPLVWWNLLNGGASFHKQISHAFETVVTDPWHNLADFLGSQFGLVTPLLFLFTVWGMGWGLWEGWRQRRPQWFLLGATSLPILLFFLQHTRNGMVQAHWCGPAYLGGIVVTVGAWLSVGQRQRLNWAFRSAPLLGAAITLLVFFQAGTAAIPLPVRIDPLKRLGGWEELAQAVDWERSAHPGVFLVSQKHELTGIVSFYQPDHPPVFLDSGKVRPSYYTADEVAALRGHDALFITLDKDDGAKDLARHFDEVIPLRPVVLHWGRRPAGQVNLYLARHYNGGAFTMGDGLPGAEDK